MIFQAANACELFLGLLEQMTGSTVQEGNLHPHHIHTLCPRVMGDRPQGPDLPEGTRDGAVWRGEVWEMERPVRRCHQDDQGGLHVRGRVY